MSFQLVGFKSFGVRTSGDTRQHTYQKALFAINAANTDTALDIANDTTGSLGTFWTAVTTDSTYGTLGSQALTQVQAIINQVYKLISIAGDPFVTYVKVLSGAAGNQYTATASGQLPTITWVSGSAPTSYVVELTWLIHDGFEAINSDLGAAF
jgi:hypothetical protein